jgi:aminopeptidase
MNHFDALLKAYAKLTLEVGVGLQPGQRMLLSADVGAAAFVRELVDQAYQMGAKYVSVYWQDEQVRRSRLLHASKESLSEIHEWQAQVMNEAAAADDAVLAIFSQDPQLLEGIDGDLVLIEENALESRTGLFWERLGSNKFNWTVVPYPTQAWADRIFPGDPNALEKFSKAMAHAVLIDQPDPSAAWRAHCETLRKRREYLNAKRYSALRYRAPGTDLELGLADDHVWRGGDTIAPNGAVYVADIPTFEVFTAPHRDRVNGTVRGTKPRSFMGTLCEDWSLEFKDGRVVGAQARVGLEALQKYLEMDEGTHYLGEVALVASGSPVDETGVVFRMALLDENAASHIAIGFAYRGTIQNGGEMSGEEFMAKGGNLSNGHSDVMIGSDQMDVDGVFADGSSEPLMRKGQFVFEQ